MSLSLRDVLELDALRRARPEVLHGEHLLDRPVRWVHTSELAEAAFLLKGGELLLTTGLGLVGRGAVGQEAYVAALAERGVAALVLELGWTFAETPDALLAAARQCDLPLVVLREVVPFVAITEEVQTALLSSRSASLRLEHDVSQVLWERLLRGGGPQQVVTALAELVHAPVVLRTLDGELVAGDGEAGELGVPAGSADITLLGRPWGRIEVLPPADAGSALVRTVCERGAEAVALALLRSSPDGETRERRRDLVDDLRAGRFHTAGELVGRARMLGVAFDASSSYTAVAIGGFHRQHADAVVHAAESALLRGPALVAGYGDRVVGLISRRAGDGLDVDRLLGSIDSASARLGAPGVARIATGPTVSGLAEAGRSVAEAQQALDLALEFGLAARCVSAEALSAQLVLARVLDDPHSDRLVADQLAALIDYDAAHQTGLVHTLETYIALAGNKVAAAEKLHVRRQTLYQRLARITDLIGDVDQPDRHTSLVLALALHGLRARRSAPET